MPFEEALNSIELPRALCMDENNGKSSLSLTVSLSISLSWPLPLHNCSLYSLCVSLSFCRIAPKGSLLHLPVLLVLPHHFVHVQIGLSHQLHRPQTEVPLHRTLPRGQRHNFHKSRRKKQCWSKRTIFFCISCFGGGFSFFLRLRFSWSSVPRIGIESMKKRKGRWLAMKSVERSSDNLI